MKTTTKKSVMGPIISVFVMILVISILSGLTFLFVSSLKTQVATTAAVPLSVVNQTGGWLNASGYTVTTDELASGITVTQVINATDSKILSATNYTLVNNKIYNATAVVYPTITLSYTYSSANGTTAYTSVNATETAGATIVGYLPLIFLAVIFGALLTLVLKIILPYINLGQNVGGF